MNGKTMTDKATEPPQALPAVGAQVDRGVRPRAWAIFVDNGNARMWSTLQPHVQKLADAEGLEVMPLYDQAALDAVQGVAAGMYAAKMALLEAEIERLNAQRREMQAERERLLDSLARAGLEASRMALQEREKCIRLLEGRYDGSKSDTGVIYNAAVRLCVDTLKA